MAAVDRPDFINDTTLIKSWVLGGNPPIPELNAQLKVWTAFFDEREATADIRRQARRLRRDMGTMTRNQIETEITALVQALNAFYADSEV